MAEGIPLEDVCLSITDCHHSTPVWTDEGYKVVRTNNIRNGIIDLSSPSFTDELHYKERISRAKPEPGDLIITREAPAGEIGQIPEGEQVCLGQRTVLIKPNPDKTNSRYLLYFLDFEATQKLLQFEATGSTVANIRIPKLKSLPILLPPLPEQRKIAAILSTWDESISTLTKLLAAKQQQKRGLAEALLTGKRRLKGFDGEWEEVKLGEIADLIAGATPSTAKKEFWGGKISWMASGDIHKKRVWDVEGRITELGLKSSSTKMLPRNSVLIALAGQGKTRGTVATNAIELCTNQSIAAIIPGHRVNWEYLFANLDSRYEELRSLSAGDGGRGGLNLGILRAVDIPLPPLPEQQAIASILSTLDAEISSLMRLKASVQQQKRGLMEVLLTGRVRVAV